jgi:hypothetical protein
LTGIIEAIQTVVREEIKKIHIMDLGVITSVFPHSSEGDKDNYECNVRIRDKDVELRKVPVATQHIGLSNMLHVNDLVLVSFINGDVNSPIIIGRLYNDEDRPPLSKMEEIVYKPAYTKNTSLRRINLIFPEEVLNINLFDDKMSIVIGRSSMLVDSSGEILINSVKSNDSDNGTEIATNDNSHRVSVKSTSGVSSINMNDSGFIRFQANPSDKICEITMTDAGVRISADSDIIVDTDSDMRVECKGDLLFKAKNIRFESQAAIKIKSGTDLEVNARGSAMIKCNTTANLEAGGPMTIKGALININP